MKIGYLGPKGSFSEEAASNLGRAEELTAYQSFELIKSLEEGKIQKAVVPIENSIEGAVNWVLDLLVKNNLPFFIEAEIIWNIRQNLIGFGSISEIKIVYSHPQALGQCRDFLDKLRIETKDANSTSEAVQLIAERGDSALAAIGTKRAAEIYNVPIIKEDISDNHNNQTRFIVLGREQKKRTGKDKTSFIFGTENKPGALYRILEVFDVLEINMTMIISRPSKRKLGEYVFFVDVEASQEDEDLRIAFKKIEGRISFLKILGSYPKAELIGIQPKKKGENYDY